MGDTVGLVQTQGSIEEIRNSIAKALDLIDFNPKNTVKSVAVKPNLCYYWDAATGYTTDPQVVAGIIDLVRERYGMGIEIQVVEADATAMRTKYAFLTLGYEKLAKEKKVKLFNLSSDSITEKKVKVRGREIIFKIPQTLLNVDLFVNVPKLKIMRETKITCAFKNIYGCIASPRKIVYHPFLNEAIVGINKILRPDLTVVDGLVALGRFPAKLGLLITSADPFSVDWVASQIAGYNPSSVKFLKIAMKEKVGNPEEIIIRGENIATFKKIFPKEPFFSLNRFQNVQLKLFKLYAKIVGDVIHPSLEGI